MPQGGPGLADPSSEVFIHEGQDKPSTLNTLLAETRHHSVFLTLVAIYLLISGFLVWDTISGSDGLLLRYVGAGLVPILAFAAFRLFGDIVYHAVHVRPFRVRGLAASFLSSEVFESDRLIKGLIPAVLIPFFSIAFTTVKTSIPEMHPFSWDTTLSYLDRAIHLGWQPWELLHPVLGYPVVTSALSYIYNLWHFVMWMIIYWQMFSAHCRVRRMQLFLAFFLCWAVLGNLAAIGFSSAGPCFYGEVVDGPDPYRGLMAYLSEAHAVSYNATIPAQAYLWETYAEGALDVGGGISAMPSMHLAIATIIAAFAMGYGRIYALAGLSFLGLILLGSIHLGWHYALDSYAGILGGLVAWRIAGRLSRRLVWYPPTEVPTEQARPSSANRSVSVQG